MLRARILVMIGLLLGSVSAVEISRQPSERVKPKFDDVPDGIFFDDAFAEALVGQRSVQVRANDRKQAENKTLDAPLTDAGDSLWRKLISAETLEDEVKAIKIATDKVVTTPARFRSGDHRIARNLFSNAALAFGIIAEYGGDVRWSDESPGIRDRFAQAAANAKVGTTQVYNEAKQRKADLQDLVSGAQVSAKPKPEIAWGQTVDRSPLMKRIEAAFEQRLTPWISSPAEFKANRQRILHEAEIVSAIAYVLTRDGMEDASDEEYAAFCQAMMKASMELSKAAQNDNADSARTAAGEISKACSQCHENYRA